MTGRLKRPCRRDLLLACEALAELVRDEWPDGYSLAQIAARSGMRTECAVALAVVETFLKDQGK